MHYYITLLTDISYALGLIGLSEYEERLAIADWLSDSGHDDQDPRLCPYEEDNHCDEPNFDNHYYFAGSGSSSGRDKDSDDCDQWLKYLILNKWMFTIGDRDCYPSVPHGHLHAKTNEWPKLNPYTGRVFSAMHKEEVRSRLNKSEMKKIWNDPSFIDHCRSQVLWYSAFAPEYNFPRARRGRLCFPRWR